MRVPSKDTVKALLIGLLIYALVLCGYAYIIWRPQTYYIADEVPWTITHIERVGKYGRYSFIVERTDENGTVHLDLTVSEEEWLAYKVGDTYMYPAEIISNGEHLDEVVKDFFDGKKVENTQEVQ